MWKPGYPHILRNMTITYKINVPISTDQFIELLRASTLGERRPLEDRTCMEGMVT